jgi:hypothetical protein
MGDGQRSDVFTHCSHVHARIGREIPSPLAICETEISWAIGDDQGRGGVGLTKTITDSDSFGGDAVGVSP